MLRTSLRSDTTERHVIRIKFLSSNAQDFIEDDPRQRYFTTVQPFLSSNAQDFIEDTINSHNSNWRINS